MTSHVPQVHPHDWPQGVIHRQGDNQSIETIVWISMITLENSPFPSFLRFNRIPIFWGDEGKIEVISTASENPLKD